MTIDEITDTTAQLSWRPGPDNHSPVTMYVIQARTPFSVGWQAVNTYTYEIITVINAINIPITSKCLLYTVYHDNNNNMPPKVYGSLHYETKNLHL